MDEHERRLDALGEDEVFEWRAGGATTREIERKAGVGTRGLYRWLKRTPERWATWKGLEELAAESVASEAREILDEEAVNPDMSAPSVSLAKARALQRQWEAGNLDGSRFGDRRAGGNGGGVNIGSVHLTVVQQVNASPPPRPVIDGEAVEILPAVVDALPGANLQRLGSGAGDRTVTHARADHRARVEQTSNAETQEPSLDELLG